MSHSVVRFKTSEGLEMTRQGSISAEDLIIQATNEFGSVEVLERRDGDVITNTDGLSMEGLIHTLEAARVNVKICLDQIESADDHRELPHIKRPLAVALDRIDAELNELLNG